MKLQTSLVALSLSFAGNAYTGEANIGIDVNLDVSGFFSHVVEVAKVTSIHSNSPAERAGLQVGDKIVAVDDLELNGSSTHETKQKMKRQPGEQLSLVVEKTDGTQIQKTLVL